MKVFTIEAFCLAGYRRLSVQTSARPKGDELLQEFLDSLADDGESHELGVGFSIDPSRLAARFATFEAQEPGYCMIRIVQGLVRLNASKIELKVERRRIVLRANFTDLENVATYLKPEELETRLSRPGLWDRTSGHLCVGVLASGAASIKRMTWTHGNSQLRSSDSGFEIVDAKGGPGLEVVLEKAAPSQEAFLSTSKEHINLLSRLHRCPVPISLDKRPISPEVIKPKKAAWHHACSGGFFLAGGFFGEQPPPDFSPLESGFGTFQGSTKTPNFLYYSSRNQWMGQLLVAVGLEGRAELYPVIDGVVGDARPLDAAVGATGFYQVSETCKTDLSGLKLVDIDEFKRQVLADYLVLLEKSLKHLKHLKAVRRGASETFGEVARILVYSGSPEALLVTPFCALLWGLRSSYYRLSFRKNREDYDHELRGLLGPQLRTRLAEARRAASTMTES